MFSTEEWGMVSKTQIERAATWEHAEGVAAFREKRRPDYARRG